MSLEKSTRPTTEQLMHTSRLGYKSGTVGNRLMREVYVTDAPFHADSSFSIDSTTAFENAIAYAVAFKVSVVRVPSGRYKISRKLKVPNGITLQGDGVDYWDTWRPDETRRKKSWVYGTHLVFTGIGAKDKTFLNLSSERPEKTVNGVVCKLTDFTNGDSVGITPATPRSFSVAVTLEQTASIRDLRVMLSNNGISGYNDYVSTSIGDNWDIGLHVYDSAESYIDNVQVLGYWRVAGTLLTENDGSLTMKGNPERTLFNKFFTTGIRGLLIRNTPQIDGISRTTNSLVFRTNPSMRVVAAGGFKLTGSSQLYTFTTATHSNGEITLSGITPAMTPQATPFQIRGVSSGNNWSGTIFQNSVAASFEHSSGASSDALGLPVAFAMEIDGYPCRNLKFINFKAQTSFDKGNTILGDMRDAKMVATEFENGILVAYDITETQGYTGNLRMSLCDIQSSVDVSAFTPRDCFYDLGQTPTGNTDGTAVFKNWRARNLELQWAGGAFALKLNESDKSIRIGDNDGITVFNYNSTKDGILKTRNFIFQADDGSEVLKMFGSSGTTVFKGIGRPVGDNATSWGTGSNRWSIGFFAQGVQTTSDARLKSEVRPMTTDELLAASDIAKSIGFFTWLREDADRDHCGTTVQSVIAIMEKHNLRPMDYGFICYDEWEDEYDEGGNLIIASGDMYSLRDHELYKFIARGLEHRISLLESK